MKKGKGEVKTRTSDQLRAAGITGSRKSLATRIQNLSSSSEEDRCWKVHGRFPRDNKRSSNEQQNLGRTDVRETASTSQLIGPTASQTSSPTLGAIAQSGLEFGEDDWHYPT
ncbi:transport protein sec23 [Cucumis melo var. makuwa]|uniref:Transport protein sec23 n=1 Tax=Cucumis melo var. makuwa TaxID=1194695 RepID=A0A5A7SUY1_CUCMM|nr:transport protein sec23 [Cucumis melo var. makuwa]TYK02375.1 transport protein sec23 [Cucumis melo var. makuwa]